MAIIDLSPKLLMKWQLLLLLLVSCSLCFSTEAFINPQVGIAQTSRTILRNDRSIMSLKNRAKRTKPPKISSSGSTRLLAHSNSNAAKDDRNRGILVLLTVPLAWGTFEPVVRFVYAIEPPIPGLVFSPCYYFVAASALTILSWASSVQQEDNLKTNASEDEETNYSALETTESNKIDNNLPLIGGLELGTYLFLGNALQVLGLKTLNSDRVAFLIQLTTIFVPLVQAIAARNLFAIPPRTWMACLIALGGVAVMGLDGSGDGSSLTATHGLLSQGDLFVIGSALAYTFHCIRLEKYAKTTRAVTLAACKATTETVLSILLVLGLISYSTNNGDSSSSNFLANFASDSGTEITSFFTTISQRLSDGSIPTSVMVPAIGAVLWTGLITCGYTIYAQSYGQSRVNPSDANLIYTFQPVWTSLIAFFLLGETLGTRGFLGGGLIGLAVYLVISGDQETPRSPEDEDGSKFDYDLAIDREKVLQTESNN